MKNNKEYPYKSIGCIHNFFYREGRRWTKEEYEAYLKENNREYEPEFPMLVRRKEVRNEKRS